MLMDEKNLKLAIRTSEENFGLIDDAIRILPLYFIGEYEDFLRRGTK